MITDCGEVASPIARKYLRFHLADHIGPIRLGRLLARFGNLDAVLSASLAELMRVNGIGEACADAIFRARADEHADRELEAAASLKLHILCPEDPGYPEPLSRIPDRPICLYVRGELRPEDAAAVAIVGTRRCTYYGREQAERFAALLCGAGFTIISGLARGIDAHAHHGALRANGRTIAVLGNGLTEVYPPEHAELADGITRNGAIISEVPLGSAPEQGHFPRRNRIIAGLSVGVLVVEAPNGSGALITARLATDYDRQVFAIPGRIDTPQAAGTNRLIRDGAKPVSCLEDVLEELQAVRRKVGPLLQTEPSSSTAVEPQGAFARLRPDEQIVLNALGPDETPLDEICSATGLPVHRVIPLLLNLRLKGWVRQFPGDRFATRSPAQER